MRIYLTFYGKVFFDKPIKSKAHVDIYIMHNTYKSAIYTILNMQNIEKRKK